MKVYILTATSSEIVKVIGSFSSYSAMMTHLYDKHHYEANYKDHIVSWSKSENYGCFIPKLIIEGRFYTLRYEVHDLIGEHCPRTGCLKLG